MLRERISAPMSGLSVTGSRVVPRADVTVSVVLESVHGGVMVAGTVETTWEGPCRRCLRQASGLLAVPVRELFAERGDPEESYPLHGDELDLGPLVRDAVVLELPLAPLCDERCQGLCPTCGVNRNEGTCRCPPTGGDPRWAALDVLREGEPRPEAGETEEGADGRPTRSD
jgi:DUF177 domain-containing protein